MNIIVGHTNTDLDCLASMLAAKQLYPDYEIVLSDILNPLTSNVVSYYITRLSFLHTTDLKDKSVDNMIVVDTRSSNRIKEYMSVIGHVNGKITVFDHHPTDGFDIPGAEINFVKKRSKFLYHGLKDYGKEHKTGRGSGHYNPDRHIC
ncbi:MAG: hypothetical protein IJM77_07630 [Spirochaetia bacterium]|nr:hypothetical protein [Spirochaetia bacterium]